MGDSLNATREDLHRFGWVAAFHGDDALEGIGTIEVGCYAVDRIGGHEHDTAVTQTIRDVLKGRLSERGGIDFHAVNRVSQAATEVSRPRR